MKRIPGWVAIVGLITVWMLVGSTVAPTGAMTPRHTIISSPGARSTAGAQNDPRSRLHPASAVSGGAATVSAPGRALVPQTTAAPSAPGRAVVPQTTAALSRLRAALGGATGKLFGISPDGNSKGIATVPQLASELGHSVNIVNIFVGWGQPLPTASMRQIAQPGSVPELTLEPWNYTQGVNQPDVADLRIADGAYDPYLTQFAAAAAAWRSPFLLRYAHEMNGNWYPWAASTNGNTAANYVAAWRHVHDLFRAAGAGNVLWVWCPNAGGPTPVADVFPGTAYVDIVGMDGYNSGTTGAAGWRTPAQVIGGLLQSVRGLAPGTPVIINETGSVEQGGDKAAWLSQLFQFVKAQPALIGVVYSNFGRKWPLTTSSAALAAAKQALSSY